MEEKYIQTVIYSDVKSTQAALSFNIHYVYLSIFTSKFKCCAITLLEIWFWCKFIFTVLLYSWMWMKFYDQDIFISGNTHILLKTGQMLKVNNRKMAQVAS